MNNIKVALAINKLTQQELADKIGVSAMTISTYISGKHSIPSDKVIEMSNVLNCSTDFILGVEEYATRSKREIRELDT